MLITSDIYLPKLKIIDYLCPTEEEKRIFEQNITLLSLDEIIEKSQLNLNMEMINGGLNFSSGQKQIILLLKIFAQSPKTLLLDEAFENIDSHNFELFKRAFENYDERIVEVSHSKKFIRNGKEVNFGIFTEK